MSENKSILGAGSYGTVRISPHDSSQVVKEMKFVPGDDLSMMNLRELYTLTLPHHPDLIRMSHADQVNYDGIKFSMPKAPSVLIKKIDSIGRLLTLEQVASVVYQIFCGLDALHTSGLVHFDVKPDNILVFEWPSASDPAHIRKKTIPEVKLADFGLVNFTKSLHHPGPNELVTLMYRPPEQMCSIKQLGSPPFEIDPASDIYSAGMVMVQLLTSWLYDDTTSPDYIICDDYDLESCTRQYAEILANILGADQDEWKKYCGRYPFTELKYGKSVLNLWSSSKKDVSAEKKSDPLLVPLLALASRTVSFDKTKRPTAKQVLTEIRAIFKRKGIELPLPVCPKTDPLPEIKQLATPGRREEKDYSPTEKEKELLKLLSNDQLLYSGPSTPYREMIKRIPYIVRDMNIIPELRPSAYLALMSWIPKYESIASKRLMKELKDPVKSLSKFYNWLLTHHGHQDVIIDIPSNKPEKVEKSLIIDILRHLGII